MAEPIAHERRDFKLKWVLGAAAALTATAVVLHLALAALQWGFMRVGGTSGQGPSEPAPAPYSGPAYDAATIERAGAEVLRAVGPAEEPGYVRIPLEQAIDRVVARGWARPGRRP